MICLHKMNVESLVNLRRILFVKSICKNIAHNNVLTTIVKKYVNRNEYQTLLNKYNITQEMAPGVVKVCFLNLFSNTSVT